MMPKQDALTSLDGLVEQLVQVEHVLDLGDEVHVLVAIPEGTNFALADDSTLRGRPIQKWLSQPRALDENGEPRLDIFNIILKARSDRDHFKAGDRTSLMVKPLLWSSRFWGKHNLQNNPCHPNPTALVGNWLTGRGNVIEVVKVR